MKAIELILKGTLGLMLIAAFGLVIPYYVWTKTSWSKMVKTLVSLAVFVPWLVMAVATQQDMNVPTEQQTKQEAVVQAPTTSVESTQEQVIQPAVQNPDPIDIESLMGKPMSEIAKQFGVEPNKAGNVVWKSEDFDLLVEPEIQYSADSAGILRPKTLDTAGFVDLAIKWLGTCKDDRSILEKVDEALRAVAIDPSRKGSPTNPQSGIDIGAVSYANYPGDWQLGVSCQWDGDSPRVSLSTRQK